MNFNIVDAFNVTYALIRDNCSKPLFLVLLVIIPTHSFADLVEKNQEGRRFEKDSLHHFSKIDKKYPGTVVQFIRRTTGITIKEGLVKVPLELSSAHEDTVTVHVRENGGSVSPKDYKLNENIITFLPGELKKNISVFILNDSLKKTGTIKLKLGQTSNAILGKNSMHTIFVCSHSYSRIEGAYYFRFNSGKRWEKYARVGKYADVMVNLKPGDDRFIFWRGSSYRPFLDTKSGKKFVENVISKNGNGKRMKFDKTNEYTQVRIVERSPSRTIVEWRYPPNLSKTGPKWWTEEYFTVYPDGVCYRAVNTGTKTLKEYKDPNHVKVYKLALTRQGISNIPNSWDKHFKLNLKESSRRYYHDLGFDKTKGDYALEPMKPGKPKIIRFTVESTVRNPALLVEQWGDAKVRFALMVISSLHIILAILELWPMIILSFGLIIT